MREAKRKNRKIERESTNNSTTTRCLYIRGVKGCGGAEVKHQSETKIRVIFKKSVSEWSETSDFSNTLFQSET